MVLKKEAIARIKAIIDKHSKYLLIAMLGQNNVPPELVAELRRQGIAPENQKSFLELAYNHNFLNRTGDITAPVSVPEMHAQQDPRIIPKGEIHESTLDYLNSNLTQLIEKQKAEHISRIESIIHLENNEFKFGVLGDLNREGAVNELFKEKSKGKIKQLLRDYTKDAARNWERIVNTELSNAISLGSMDRIVSMNKDTPPDEIIVYRIVKNDAALCKYCKKFYLDDDDTPVLYRLSTILANGSNYGKKAIDWLPVATATHPNERCSQLIQLRPGWRVVSGGSVTFMGTEEWKDYIDEKLRA